MSFRTPSVSEWQKMGNFLPSGVVFHIAQADAIRVHRLSVVFPLGWEKDGDGLGAIRVTAEKIRTRGRVQPGQKPERACVLEVKLA